MTWHVSSLRGGGDSQDDCYWLNTVEDSKHRVVLLGIVGEGPTTACYKTVTILENATQGLGLSHILCKDQYKDNRHDKADVKGI